MWERAEEATREAFAELTDVLGAQCREHALPESLREAWDWQRTIMEAEMAANLDIEWEKGRERLSQSLYDQLARGREVRALDYQKALARIPLLNQGFDDLFASYDAVLTTAASGSAPKLATTGDPAFCTLWTLCGMPAVSLPLMSAENGLPLGVQLVGRRGDDARLLRTARWLVARVQTD